MFYKNREILIPRRNTTLNLICWSDPHIDESIDSNLVPHGYFHYGAFAELLEQLRQPNTYHINLGDNTEGDNKRGRKQKRIQRAQADDHTQKKLSPEDIKDMSFLDEKVIPAYRQISHNCLGMIRGNHYKDYGNGDTDIDYIAMKSGIEMLGSHRGYLDLSFRFEGTETRMKRTIYMTHGSGSSQSEQADVAKLQKQTGGELADIYLGAHSHFVWCIPQIMRYTQGEIKSKTILYGRCGSMRKSSIQGQDDYLDAIDAKPRPVGFLKIKMHIYRLGGGTSGGFGVQYEPSVILPKPKDYELANTNI